MCSYPGAIGARVGVVRCGVCACLSVAALSLLLKLQLNSSFHHERRPPPHALSDEHVEPPYARTMSWHKLANMSQHAHSHV